MIISVTKPHDREQLIEELLEEIPSLHGALRADGYRDAPDGFVVSPKGQSTDIEFPNDEIAAMAEVVIEAHQPTESKAEAERRKIRERLARLRASKDNPPTAAEWADILKHVGVD